MKKTVLASAILTSLFSGMSVAASNFDDFCNAVGSEYSDCYYDDTVHTSNELDLNGHDFSGAETIEFRNESNSTEFIINNLSLQTLSADYEYDADEGSQYGYGGGVITFLIGGDYGKFVLNGWNINIEQQTHSLISDESYYTISDIGNNGGITLNNSSIKANADTLLSFENSYIDIDVDPDTNPIVPINLLTVNNSTLINTKQHSFYDGRITDSYGYPDEEPTIGSDQGSIIMLNAIRNMLWYDETVSLSLDFKNSQLESDAFATISLYDDAEPTDSNYNLTFTNSEGKFKNLFFRTGESGAEGVFSADNINITLDNSTITAGVYSEYHGGYRNTHTVMNLTNNSVFNYLGDCQENCNYYSLVEDDYSNDPWFIEEYGDYITEHPRDSYIHKINISGNSTLAFSSEGDFKQFYVDEMTSDGTANLLMNTDLSAGKADHLFLKNASGEFNVMVNDSGAEPNTNILVALITVDSGRDSNFVLNKGNGVDIGAYVYDLKAIVQVDKYVWFLDQQTQNDSNQNCNVCTDNEKNKPIVTSPSTDAVLSLASANQFILNDELQNLRMRRGDVMSNNHASGNVWGRLINNRLTVEGPVNSSYKMNRAGMELGSDKVFHLGDDRLMLGVTGSLSDNKVKHTRGGTSDVDAYSVGLYATYLTESNFYLDGTVKYTHFNNSLNAVTTNGSNVTSDYKQHGMGAALELGYYYQNGAIFVEPYGRMSYVDVQGKSVTLSNGLKAKIDNQKSLLGEVGVSAGIAAYSSDSMTISPYAKIAFEHEFLKDNHVTINNAHQFSNDFSGTAGKYGAGVNVVLGKNTSIFGEVNYVKGRNIESPIKASVGFRISF